MQLFWLLVFFLTLFAVILVAMPFFKTAKSPSITQPQLQVALYREQLQDLDNQLTSGAITTSDYEILKHELDFALLNETSTANMHDQKNNWLMPFILIILLPLVAINLYFHWGDSKKISQWLLVKKQQEIVKTDIAKFGSIQNMTAALQQRVEQTPENPQGWYLLGKLYLGQADYTNAIKALQKANALKPNDKNIMLAFAESLFLSQQKLSEVSRSLLEKVLQSDPNNSNAINLIALDAYHRADYQIAIANWQKLLADFPADSDAAQQLTTLIANAKHQLALQTSIKILIRVTVSSSLQTQLDPNDTIFIYAKAVQGPPMPLAVIRVPVKDLGHTVTLSDANNMVTTLSLSNYNGVKIFARISKSGQALEQTGDLQGESQVFDPKKQKDLIVVEINKIL